MIGTRHAVVVTHTRLRESGTVVEEAVEQLRRANFEVTIIDNIEAPEFGSRTPAVPKNTEIVVVLGGDGTILRAAELVHATEVPILGVNLGHVGFLAEFESFQMSEAIRRIADHDYSIDERMIAHVDVWLPGATEPIEDWALNDITLERADRGKMVELSIRGVPFTNRLVTKFDLPVVGWREQARKTGGTHHGQSFPRTGKPESGK